MSKLTQLKTQRRKEQRLLKGQPKSVSERIRLRWKGGYQELTRTQLPKLLYQEPEPTLVRVLLDELSAGKTPQEACTLAGIDKRVLEEWLRRANKPESEAVYTDFRRLYAQALATAQEQKQAVAPLIQGFDIGLLCTPERLEQIFDYMRKGVFPAVAVEATGIPADVFFEALAHGKEHVNSPYRTIYTTFLMMQAQARAGAEMRVYEESPLAWLLHGPGRDRPNHPGWTRQSSVTGPNGGAISVITTQWGGQQAASPPAQGPSLSAHIVESER